MRLSPTLWVSIRPHIAETSLVRPKIQSQSKQPSDSVDLPKEEDAESVVFEGSVQLPGGDPSNYSNESEQPVVVPMEEDLPTNMPITFPDGRLSLESEVENAGQSEVANPNAPNVPCGHAREDLTSRRSTHQLRYSVLGNVIF